MADGVEKIVRRVDGDMGMVRELVLRRAFDASHGSRGIPEPSVRRVREVTETDKEAVLKAHASVSPMWWAQCYRDATCLELGLTKEQVDMVVAGRAPVPAAPSQKAPAAPAKRISPAAASPTSPAKPTAKPVARVTEKPARHGKPASGPPVEAGSLLPLPEPPKEKKDALDPASWPKKNWAGEQPTSTKECHNLPDDEDKAAILAAWEIANGKRDRSVWPRFSAAYGAHRGLTTQQIAGILAVHNRSKK